MKWHIKSNAVILNEEFVAKLKYFLVKTKEELNKNSELNEQIKWELLKYKIRCFTISFSKELA